MAPAPQPATTPPMKATSNGSFQGENPLDYTLPLLVVQIILVVVFTRFLAYLLKPLRQPRVIAEVIGGCLLGPPHSGGARPFYTRFSRQNLYFFFFLVGLELDIDAIGHTGKKSLGIALCEITLPFVLGIGTSEALLATVSKGMKQGPFLVFNGVALSITAFPVLARILAELKLLTTDVGRIPHCHVHTSTRIRSKS
ncbi:cation/H(+) antiporter 19 [Rosa chinensis]|uniref:cation/H(+) antiporter 19 n=1 Tax=Rosa chinensis TaxID=74649 RepID=UPI001AD8CEC8|nr:cation/H(+) antiporter 19 [Rosa chinensis]